MNICVVSNGFPPDDAGGIGVYVYHLVSGLVKLGHTVFVITRSAGGKDIAETINGVTVYRSKPRHLPKLEKWFPGLIWSRYVAQKIEEIDRKCCLDVVEFQNWEGVGLWYLLKRRHKLTVVRLITPYFETLALDKKKADITFSDRFICWMEKRASLMADRLLAPTHQHADFISKAYNLQPGRVQVVLLGIQVPELPVNYVESKCTRKSDKLRVLYVSRFEHRKGTITLFAAIPRVLDACPDVEFIFIGRDRNHAPGGMPFKDYFLKHYAPYHAGVKFLGVVSNDELEANYRNSDIFVVPSLYESFGLIYVEAMAYGLPVIGGCLGGMQEVIDDTVTGYRVQAGNSTLLAERIIELARDKELRKTMGLAGVKRVRELFDRDKMAENSVALYHAECP